MLYCDTVGWARMLTASRWHHIRPPLTICYSFERQWNDRSLPVLPSLFPVGLVIGNMQIVCDSSQLRLCAEGAVSEAVTPSSKLCMRQVHRCKHCLPSLDTDSTDSPLNYMRSSALNTDMPILRSAPSLALPRSPLWSKVLNISVTTFSIFAKYLSPVYVVCPKSKSSDFPMYELAT